MVSGSSERAASASARHRYVVAAVLTQRLGHLGVDQLEVAHGNTRQRLRVAAHVAQDGLGGEQLEQVLQRPKLGHLLLGVAGVVGQAQGAVPRDEVLDRKVEGLRGLLDGDGPVAVEQRADQRQRHPILRYRALCLIVVETQQHQRFDGVVAHARHPAARVRRRAPAARWRRVSGER